MTTEEKLQHFLDTCMEDARTRSNRMLDEYMTALEQTFEEHKADARRHADTVSYTHLDVYKRQPLHPHT